MKKPVVLAIAAAAFVGGGWWLVSSGLLSKASAKTNPDRFIARAEKRDIDFSVEVSGDVTPANQLEVKSEVSGKIKACMWKSATT
jgi:multidrug efflux pump subunit AcrA (membrane-fusion protein)